jgi:hypothetical protein
MIYMWFTGINYYKLAVEKDHDYTIITSIWKPEAVNKRQLHKLIASWPSKLYSI